jgi:predicted transcriptional regulator
MTQPASEVSVRDPKQDSVNLGLIVFSTRLPEALIKRLKHLAIDMERSVRSLVEEAVERYLKDEEPKH